jgi:hypothetical protein
MARDGGWPAPTLGVVDSKLQRSASDEIRLHRGARRRATWCWLGAVTSRTERQRARAATRVSIFAGQNSS